jgi:Fe-S cluster assembly protein SufD
VSQPRNLFVVGRNSQATFVESFRTLGSNIGFTNVVTEVVVQENAVAEYYKIQNETSQAITSVPPRRCRPATVSFLPPPFR